MIIDMASDKLEIGMYIILPDSLLENPFWKSKFEIKNEKQIKKILKAGINNIKVDTEKCKINIPIPETVTVVEASSQAEGEKAAEPPAAETVIEVAAPEANPVKEPPKQDKKEPAAAVAKTPVITVKEPPKQDKKEPASPPDKWDPEKFMPPQLVEAFKDTSMPPADRAKVVQDYSTEMMKNILDNPTEDNLTATKDGIYDMVDLIMNEGETCDSLTKLVSHDFYTYTHSVNVGLKSMLLAKEFYGDSSTHDMHELGAGFFLHDIGKVNIPAEIINKKGRLTDGEMDTMRKHPEESQKLLSSTNHLTSQAKIIVMHNIMSAKTATGILSVLKDLTFILTRQYAALPIFMTL